MCRTYSAGTWGSMFEAHQIRVTNMQNPVSSGYLVGTMLEAHKRGHQFTTCSPGNWVGSMFEADQGGGTNDKCAELVCLKLPNQRDTNVQKL
jgi:hypothetical protein